MKMYQVLAGIAGLAMFATAGVAAPSNFASSRRIDFYLPGKHQFYVWCATGQDRIAYQDGASATDAKAKLLITEKSSGMAGCRPAWQARIKA
jgi:hypothetical protein